MKFLDFGIKNHPNDANRHETQTNCCWRNTWIDDRHLISSDAMLNPRFWWILLYHNAFLKKKIPYRWQRFIHFFRYYLDQPCIPTCKTIREDLSDIWLNVISFNVDNAEPNNSSLIGSRVVIYGRSKESL